MYVLPFVELELQVVPAEGRRRHLQLVRDPPPPERRASGARRLAGVANSTLNATSFAELQTLIVHWLAERLDHVSSGQVPAA